MFLGLRSYLKQYKYDSPGWKELLTSFDEAVDYDTRQNRLNGSSAVELFEPYFRQMGYPVLKIKWSPYGFTVNTRRYLQEGQDYLSPTSEFGYQWKVPIVYQEAIGDLTQPLNEKVLIAHEFSIFFSKILSL